VRGPEVVSALERLADPELELLERTLRRGDQPHELARELGVDETELTIQLVALVRGVGGGPQAVSPIEYEIGCYLISGANINDRDREGHQLAMSNQVDPVELDRLDRTVARIRKISSRRWMALRKRRSSATEAGADV